MPDAPPLRLRLHWSDRTGNGNKIVMGGAQRRRKLSVIGRISKAVRDVLEERRLFPYVFYVLMSSVFSMSSVSLVFVSPMYRKMPTKLQMPNLWYFMTISLKINIRFKYN